MFVTLDLSKQQIEHIAYQYCFYMFFTDLITYVKKTYFERTNVTN